MSSPADLERLSVARSPRRGDVFDVRFTHLSDKGEGVARIDLAVGPGAQPLSYSVVARGGLPNELATVRILGRYRRTYSSIIDALIEPSEQRITPKCRHFGSPTDAGKGCGGCSSQHLQLAAQRDEKGARIRRLLQSANLDDSTLEPVRAASAPWHYRNKMELSFGNDRERSFSLGMHPAGYRYETLALQECWLMSPFVSAFVPLVGEWASAYGLSAFDARQSEGQLRTLTIREGKRTDERMVVLETEASAALPDSLGADFVAAVHKAAQACGGKVDSIYWAQRDAARGRKTSWTHTHLDGAATITERLHLADDVQLSFAISPQSFFQPSTAGAETIYNEVVRQSGLRERTGGEPATVLDLYCGTGTISLCVAPWAERVIGVELVEEAVLDGRANAVRNGAHNVELHAGDTADVLAKLKLHGGQVDVVIVDPPRAGLRPAAIAEIAQIQPSRVVYVACQPQSLARDAALFRGHGYALTTVVPIDQFPHTGHIECVATLLWSDELPSDELHSAIELTGE